MQDSNNGATAPFLSGDVAEAQLERRHEYKVGDLVVLRRENLTNVGKSTKLVPKYNRRYVIKEVFNNDRYVVDDLPGSRHARKKYRGTSSVDRMKPFPAA